MEAILLILGLLAGVGAGYYVRKTVSEGRMGTAEARAQELLANARREAETQKREALMEVEYEALRIRKEAEAELKSRSGEVQQRETRLLQRESSMDAMARRVDEKERSLSEGMAEAGRIRQELEEVLGRQKAQLERNAGMTGSEAKEMLIRQIESEAKRDAMALVRDIESQAR
ncbi:MAG: Rnase Y domain-containing protein, partial [Actinomycetota bacterium]